MKDSIPAVVPTRENWRQFCEEPELSHEEWALWRELGALARRDKRFFELCFAKIPPPSGTPGKTKDWSDVVQSAEKYRRYFRAHFPLYRDYLADLQQTEMELAVR